MEWYYFVLMAAVSYAFFIIYTKKALLIEHSIEFSSVLSIVLFLFSLPLLFFINFDLNTSQIALIYVSSSLFTMAFLFNMRAIRHMDVSIVAPLMTFNVAITSILAIIFLGERLTAMQVIGILFLLAGAYILQTHHRESSLFEPLKKMFTSRHVMYLLASLLMFSLAFLIIKNAISIDNPERIGAIDYIFLLNGFVALNFFIMITLFYNGIKTYKAGMKQLKLIAIPAALILIYRILQVTAMSLPYAKLSLIVALNEVYVFFVVLIGGRMFHEHNLARKITGTAVILIGIYLVIYAGL